MRTVVNQTSLAAPLPAWRPALVWALCSAAGAAAVAPYLLSLLPQTGLALPPPGVLAGVLAAQTGVLAFLLGWAGTAVGRGMGLGSPLLEALLRGQRPGLPRSLADAALLGALAGLVIVGLDTLLGGWMPPAIGQMPPQPGPWHGLLASLYGGVTEEVLTRLGLTTLLAWAASRWLGAERRVAVGGAIVAAALLFGALHLPVVAQIWPLTALVVARTLLLNAVGGVLAGFLYQRHGLEHAIAAHFCADLVLHVLVPALRGA